MKNADQLWQEYSDRYMPASAGKIQRRETRRAFMCGIQAVFLELAAAADDPTAHEIVGGSVTLSFTPSKQNQPQRSQHNEIN